MALSEQELDFGYAEGFLTQWLEKAPAQVKEHLQTLVEAINFYKGKLATAEQLVSETNARYNALTIQTAQYLELMSQQKELLDQTLIESQRDLHPKRELPQI